MAFPVANRNTNWVRKSIYSSILAQTVLKMEYDTRIFNNYSSTLLFKTAPKYRKQK